MNISNSPALPFHHSASAEEKETIHSPSSNVHFKFDAQAAEAREGRDLASFHESLQTQSPTYRNAVLDGGLVKVKIAAALQEAGLTTYKHAKNKMRIDINPGARINEHASGMDSHSLGSLRKTEARISLVFEMFNAASKREMKQIEDKALQGGYETDARSIPEDLKELEAEFGKAKALFAMDISEIEFKNTKKTHQVDDEINENGGEPLGMSYNFPTASADLTEHLVDSYCSGQLDNYCNQYAAFHNSNA
jgi:hypothetical protein